MSAHISWFNLENSLNPFEPHEESSPMMSRNNQNSISFFGRFPSFPRQQQSRSLFNIHAFLDNILGKNDNLTGKEDKFTFQFIIGANNVLNASDSSPESESQIQQSSQEMMQFQTKKGLKNLAKLLIRILKKRKIDSSKYITAEIEQILMKGKKLSKNEFARQSKNIRRRTYDALNVMIAANVLGPDLAFVKRIHASSFTRKQAVVFGQKKQIETKISQLTQKLQDKKLFLKQLRSKKSTLQWWMNTKKMQSEKRNESKQQFLKALQKVNNGNFQRYSERISLPAIFIHDIDENAVKRIEMKSQDLVVINSENRQMKLFSEIDAFQILKFKTQMQGEVLFKEQEFNDFNSRLSDEKKEGK